MKKEAKKNMVMNKPLLTIVLDDSRWEQELPIAEDLANKAFDATIDFVGCTEPSDLTRAKLPI